jgi:hydrogenase maturation protein HypF
MCSACQKEYEDPLNRRFHAQPNACSECGPHVWLIDKQGKEVSREKEALEETASLLAHGHVLAIKGLGGFHLACDATNDTAVKLLRQRKNRPAKPLAIMVPDIATVRQVARIDSHEEELLLGREHPIVVLKKTFDTGLSPYLAPDTNYIGLMLPYTPLHCILLFLYQKYIGSEKLPALVMTSGNFSSEPISLGNREALKRLAKIADYFLVHNRDILIRCDDSVVYTGGGKRLFFRRARGYTPSPVFLAFGGDTVLGVGPELKNTICLTKENQAFVSQHIGDLKNLETYEFFLETISHLQKILQVRPKAIVCDLHPDYLSTKYAREQGLPVYSLQHHFAHIHAVLAENKFTGPCLGLALDGTGYGEDGTLWGGELLLVDNMRLSHARLGCFRPIPLPGGEAAIHEPWRIARSFLYLLEKLQSIKEWPWLKDFAKADQIVLQMLSKDVNCPRSSSCGRFFDAVAALLGLKLKIDYEGQAAILLEKVQDFSEDSFYQVKIKEKNGLLVFDTVEFMAQIVNDMEKGLDRGRISRRFHLGLMHGLCEWAKKASIVTGIKHVALSGGVMQNLTLHRELPEMLKRQGFKVLVHRQVPPNDACISLGQAVYGMLRRRRGEGQKG